MKKPTSKKLSLNRETIRTLQSDELAHVNGGSLGASGTSVISGSNVMTIGTSGTSVISSGTSVISFNPSGGRH